jgi:cobyrinic acid a,c-diamide synthase
MAGDSGKTLVSLAVILLARRSGVSVRAFKKGPDYIDAAWLGWACGRPARNLDTYLMGFAGAADSFARHADPEGLNLIEGNRGLFDGVDARGTHSTAALARELNAPVILVVNAAKTTRTAAAGVLGCRVLDPAVRIAGVILNRTAGERHAALVRESIEEACGVPVFGALPRIPAGLLPERHLGLVTPGEHAGMAELSDRILAFADGRLDLDGILKVAGDVPPVAPAKPAAAAGGPRVTVGYLRDSAFSFYYPDNLEALEAAGADLVPISSLRASSLPPGLGALYMGGGFPETHAAALAANTELLGSIRGAAAAGMPVWAECGGLMLLARAIRWRGERYEMAGVLPFEVEVLEQPQGHGYATLRVDRPNAFLPEGTELRGHEFHYSRVGEGERPGTACAVLRGSGCYGGRDGVIAGNVWAGYTHLHATGSPEWAPAVVNAARKYGGKTEPPAAKSDRRRHH